MCEAARFGWGIIILVTGGKQSQILLGFAQNFKEQLWGAVEKPWEAYLRNKTDLEDAINDSEEKNKVIESLFERQSWPDKEFRILSFQNLKRKEICGN